MPTTTVVRSIGTAGGRDYSTLQAWEDACPVDLVAVDQVWKGECYNDSEFTVAGTTLLTISGTTTDATRYLWLTAAAGQSFADHANKATNPPKYDQSKGVGLRVTANYAILISTGSTKIFVSRLQFYYDSTYASGYYPGITGWVSFEGCICQTRQGSAAGYFWGANDAFYAANTLFLSVGTGPGRLINHRGAGTPATIRNCTLVKASDAASGGVAVSQDFGSSFDIRNTAVFGPWTTHFGTNSLAAASDRIFTDAASVPAGTNHSAGLTYADQFEGTTIAAPDFRAKGSGVLDGSATRDQTYTADLDIVGRARSISAPTIGAWEVIAAAAPVLSLPTVTDIGATSVRPRVTLTF